MEFHWDLGISTLTQHLVTVTVWGLLHSEIRTTRVQCLCLIQVTVTLKYRLHGHHVLQRGFIITIQ